MTTGSRYVTPFAYAYTPVGVPIPGALLNFYLTESATRSDTFKTSDLAGPVNTNPVVADDKGTFPSIFLDPAVVYKVVHTYPPVLGAAAVEIWTADPVYVVDDNGTEPGAPPGPSPDAIIPTGAIMEFATPGPPTGWLACNGAAVARTLYPDLFTAIGTTWGAGDGVNTFNVPDRRNRFGLGASPEHAAATTGGVTAHDHGAVTGEHAADASEMPLHRHHMFSAMLGDADATGDQYICRGTTDHPGEEEYIMTTAGSMVPTIGITGDAGGDEDGEPVAHTHTVAGVDILPPFIAMLFCIKT